MTNPQLSAYVKHKGDIPVEDWGMPIEMHPQSYMEELEAKGLAMRITTPDEIISDLKLLFATRCDSPVLMCSQQMGRALRLTFHPWPWKPGDLPVFDERMKS